MSSKHSINAMIDMENLKKWYLIDHKTYLMESIKPIEVKGNIRNWEVSCFQGNLGRDYFDILPELVEIQEGITQCDKNLGVLHRLKEQVLQQIKGISAPNKAKYLRDYIGMTWAEIAGRLRYSQDHVKKLYAAANNSGHIFNIAS